MVSSRKRRKNKHRSMDNARATSLDARTPPRRAATSAFSGGGSEALGRKATTSAQRQRAEAEASPTERVPNSPSEATTALRAGPWPGLGSRLDPLLGHRQGIEGGLELLLLLVAWAGGFCGKAQACPLHLQAPRPGPSLFPNAAINRGAA